MTEPKLIPSEYFNISQFRLDHWNNLKANADLLYAQSQGGSIEKELIKRIEEDTSNLEIIEQFWAFPGVVRLNELKKLNNSHINHIISSNIEIIDIVLGILFLI